MLLNSDIVSSYDYFVKKWKMNRKENDSSFSSAKNYVSSDRDSNNTDKKSSVESNLPESPASRLCLRPSEIYQRYKLTL